MLKQPDGEKTGRNHSREDVGSDRNTRGLMNF